MFLSNVRIRGTDCCCACELDRSRSPSGGGTLPSSNPSTSTATSTTTSSSSSYFRPSAAMRALRRRSQGASSLLSDYTQALWGGSRSLLKADSSLLSTWAALAAAGGSEGGSGGGWGVKDSDRGGFAASKAMRRHFVELTSAFLEPFRMYFEPRADGLVSGVSRGGFGSVSRVSPEISVQRCLCVGFKVGLQEEGKIRGHLDEGRVTPQ
jgi:hypothetical protein